METEQCNCEQSQTLIKEITVLQDMIITLQDSINDLADVNAVIQASNDELEKENLLLAPNLQTCCLIGLKEGLDINCEVG